MMLRNRMKITISHPVSGCNGFVSVFGKIPIRLATYAPLQPSVRRPAARVLMKRLEDPVQHGAVLVLEGEFVEQVPTEPPPEHRQ
jgi:hypothetical protein